MKTSGAILLVSCYELGHQPFHLGSLSAFLHKAGYTPRCVDTAIDDLTDEAIQAAQLVAVSVPMHTALRLGEQIAQRVRAVNPQAHICFYGLYAQLNTKHLLDTCVDSTIGGEYEMPLLKLVQTLERDQPLTIPGISTRQQGSTPWIERTPFLIPERDHLPPLERYAYLQLGDDFHVTGYTETTRGCKHTCRHCPITPVYQGRFFAVPRDVVLADIRTQVARGARHITFGDPDFWNGPTHAMRIINAMHQEFPDLTFDATIKIEHLLQNRQLLPALKDAGCLFVVSAVESLNNDVLTQLAKGHTADDVALAFDEMERVGIALRPSLLPFTPWETLESYIELLDFFETRHLIEHIDPVHLSIRLLVPPGSAHLDTPESQQWLLELDAAAYSYRWQHPDPRMDTLQQQVAALAEKGNANTTDPTLTFFEIKARAQAMLGQRFSVFRAFRQYGTRKILPHLTESWFCCAEPTTSQLGTGVRNPGNVSLF